MQLVVSTIKPAGGSICQIVSACHPGYLQNNIKFLKHHPWMWMDTAMHDMGSLGRMLQIDLPRDWASLALHRDVWRGVVSRC